MNINFDYTKFYELGSKETLQQILEYISPYVIVTGSYAHGTQSERSDIDFYIKNIPEDLIDYEAAYVEDTYCRPLMRFFAKLGYLCGSVMIESFHVDDTYIPLEFSGLYDIEDEVFPIEILGVTMQASKSNHTSDKYINGQKREKLEE